MSLSVSIYSYEEINLNDNVSALYAVTRFDRETVLHFPSHDN